MTDIADFRRLTSRMVRRHELSRRDIKKLQQMKRLIPLPEREVQRVLVLRQANLLECSPDDLGMNRLIHLLRRIYMTPVVAIAFVDLDRTILKAKIGLATSEFPRELCMCSRAVQDNIKTYFSILDAKADPCFCHFPAVAAPQGLRFYAGAPIFCSGLKIGTLCIGDPNPRAHFDPTEAARLVAVADLLSSLIEERRARMLEQEKQLAELVVAVTYRIREPLIAAIQEKENLREAMNLVVQSYLSPTRTDGVYTGNLQWSLPKFIQFLQRLQEEMELSLQTSLVYFPPSGFRSNRSFCSSAAAAQKSPAANTLLRDSWTSEKLINYLIRSTRKKYTESGLQIKWSVDHNLRDYEVSVNLKSLALALDVALALQRHLLGREYVQVRCSLTTLCQLKHKDNVTSAKLLVTLRPAEEESHQSANATSSNSEAPKPASNGAAEELTVLEKKTVVKSAQMLCRSFLGVSRGNLLVNNEEDDVMTLWVPCLCRPSNAKSPARKLFAEELRVGLEEVEEGEEEHDEGEEEHFSRKLSHRSFSHDDLSASMFSRDDTDPYFDLQVSLDETLVLPHSLQEPHLGLPYVHAELSSSSDDMSTGPQTYGNSGSSSFMSNPRAAFSPPHTHRSRRLRAKSRAQSFSSHPNSTSSISTDSMHSRLSRSSHPSAHSGSWSCLPCDADYNHNRVANFLSTHLRPFRGVIGNGYT